VIRRIRRIPRVLVTKLPSARPNALSLTAVLLAVTLFACDRAPSASDLPEWTPQDHDRKEESGRAAQGQAPQAGGKPRKSSPAEEAAQLAELTWSTQCNQCHGPLGKGDGPTGPMVGAQDLTRADWQDRTKDAELAASIRNGKGKMPKFDLSDAVIEALVKRIRKNRVP
jgi:cytochrome c oxidase cbb3-type subunit 3